MNLDTIANCFKHCKSNAVFIGDSSEDDSIDALVNDGRIVRRRLNNGAAAAPAQDGDDLALADAAPVQAESRAHAQTRIPFGSFLNATRTAIKSTRHAAGITAIIQTA